MEESSNLRTPYDEYRDSLEEFLHQADEKIDRSESDHQPSFDNKERLISIIFSHLDEYHNRLNEIGGFGVGGLEPDLGLPFFGGTFKIDTDRKKEMYDLQDSVMEYWVDASMGYVHGNFRAAIFQSATMLESGLRLLVLESEIETEYEDYFEGQNATLGPLIQFLTRQEVLPQEVLEETHRLKKLRNEHIHQLKERGLTKKEFKKKRDEFIPLGDFKGEPPVKIQGGSISGDGVTMEMRNGKVGVLYPNKKDARRAIQYSRDVLQVIYPKDTSDDGKRS